jgi:hypothetical protein
VLLFPLLIERVETADCVVVSCRGVAISSWTLTCTRRRRLKESQQAIKTHSFISFHTMRSGLS